MADGLEFGVDWYPEQWDRSLWESDARRMAGYGFSVARVMEFAWTIVEPEPGRFDFSLFDTAVETLDRYGLRAVIGTPTATPPSWLVRASPDTLRVAPSGRAHDFGARRNLCYNAPAYREAAARVVAAVADHYGDDRRVAGFQVDNEVGHEGSDRCVCEHCRRAWHRWLATRYDEIDAVNEAWGTRFWNTTYASFDEVPVPRVQPATRHNPGLLLDYDRFCSDSAVGFAQAQTDVLRAKAAPGQWITTNLFPPPLSNAIDMEDLTAGMDFASWDNYPVWGDQDEPYPWAFNALVHSYTRGLRGGAPFTVMEEMSGIQGHVCLGRLPPEPQVALWAVQAVARGANRVVFFRWRTAPFGQEQLCHGLLDADDRETERLRVLAAMMARARKELSGIASVPVASRACVVYSRDDARVLREQYLSRGLYLEAGSYGQAGYDVELARWAGPYAAFGVNVDVASARSLDLTQYDLVSLPLYQMADPALVTRLEAWVEAGGTLVIGYRAGARDLLNQSGRQPLPGLFRRLAGVTVPRFESLNTGSAKLRVGLLPARGRVWADIIEPEGAETVATWTDRGRFYRGAPAATVNRVGKGRVWYLGTSLDTLGIFFLYRRILREAGLKPRFAGADVESIDREDAAGGRWTLLLNHSPKRRRAFGTRLEPWGWNLVPR